MSICMSLIKPIHRLIYPIYQGYAHGVGAVLHQVFKTARLTLMEPRQHKIYHSAVF